MLVSKSCKYPDWSCYDMWSYGYDSVEYDKNTTDDFAGTYYVAIEAYDASYYILRAIVTY